MAQCVKCGNDVKPEEKQRLSTFFGSRCSCIIIFRTGRNISEKMTPGLVVERSKQRRLPTPRIHLKKFSREVARLNVYTLPDLTCILCELLSRGCWGLDDDYCLAVCYLRISGTSQDA